MKSRRTLGLAVLLAASASVRPATQTSLLAPSLVGRDNFTAYCAPCHGREGRGDGPVVPSLRMAPPDLTKLKTRNGGVFPRQRLEAFVTRGDPDAPAHGTSEMPVWGPTFRSLDSSDRRVKTRIANLVTYIESIQTR